MAEAGFFQVASSGESTEPNVECFVCAITLDGWLQHEEPFKEHLAHSPLCPFAQAGKPQGRVTVREWIEVLRARNDKINVSHTIVFGYLYYLLGINEHDSTHTGESTEEYARAAGREDRQASSTVRECQERLR